MLEEVRLGMEMNRAEHNQRRVATLRYLGEVCVRACVGFVFTLELRMQPALSRVTHSVFLPVYLRVIWPQLFNYQLVQSKIIFNALYALITFAAGTPLDAPDHYLRVKLVCTVLDSCGSYFDTGRDASRLDAFLVFFQRYMLAKVGGENSEGNDMYLRERFMSARTPTCVLLTHEPCTHGA